MDKKTSLSIAIFGVIVLLIKDFIALKINSTIYFILLSVGLVLLVVGCWCYAKAKGYSGVVGLLLGLILNVVGLIILALLTDKIKADTDRNKGMSNTAAVSCLKGFVLCVILFFLAFYALILGIPGRGGTNYSNIAGIILISIIIIGIGLLLSAGVFAINRSSKEKIK